ncbi:MAG: hypothetical protein IPM77_12795 [Crocinitomicaceae bacterium]|nr:hypothetical protein [Crocinitomicaceae bacterium]
MQFFAIERFVLRYNLIRKYSKFYSCIDVNFYEAFHAIAIEELYIKKFQIFEKPPVKLIKIRLSSCTNNGDSYGFRVLTFVNIETQKCYFLDIYPKYGKLHQADFDKNELKDFLKEKTEEEKEGTLFSVLFQKKEPLVEFKQA